MLGFAKKLFGSSNDRKVKAFQDQAQRINVLEPKFAALSDDELRMMTDAFKDRLERGESLDKILPEAFAVVREASKRVLGQRQYDVQLAGGMILHEGGIAEMRTGEGKTLVAVAPVYLNALAGKGVHVITVNDYLARRDAETMGRVYRFLGLEVGVIVNGLSQGQRQAAYAADVTYGTNNEFGFDYLRDNLVYDRREMVQRPHNFAIVDEVDSILIDEARTPLIISGPTEDRSDLYKILDGLIKELITDKSTYELDEKQKQVLLTEEGSERIEQALEQGGHFAEDTTGLYDAANISLVHHTNQALRANTLYQRDKDYIIKGEEIVLIDEFTGRMMTGRRLSEGLHQAIEAKEGVKIQPENQTLASVTIQNYFRLYEKLSGMTGTAATEAQEFGDIYKMDVLEVPTNRPIQRKDHDDEVYRTHAEKNQAIARQIAECHLAGQPILVGTVSIERSEQLSDLLSRYEYKVETARTLKAEYAGKAKEAEKVGDAAYDITYETRLRGIPHNVLNARQHEQEAYIVAEAGKPGTVTIATNMAGRGTDIQLGGNVEMKVMQALAENPEANPDELRARIEAEHAADKQAVLNAGGLFVLATERHESRRIDNQLRGRSGRQGDPGRSLFFLSLEDDLMRIFGSERLDKVLSTLGMKDGEAIVHPWVNKSLERAQAKVEGRNFDIRKQLLKFDDVMNDQRKAIFSQRREIMESGDVSDIVADMRHQVIDDLIDDFLPERAYPEQWDTAGLKAAVVERLNMDLPIADWAAEDGVDRGTVAERIREATDGYMAQKADQFGPEQMGQIEKQVLLQQIDGKWREHLVTLEHLRSVVGFRGYAQRDPLSEYKTEAFQLFENLLEGLRGDVTQNLARIRPLTDAEREQMMRQYQAQLEAQAAAMRPQHEEAEGGEPSAHVPGFDANDPSTWGNPSRNDPCPCGSGERFKNCHGRLV